MRFGSDDLKSDGSSREDPDLLSNNDEEAPVAQTWDQSLAPVGGLTNRQGRAQCRCHPVACECPVGLVPNPTSKKYQTWEPAASRSETHDEEVQLAMRFADSGMQYFREFCKTDDFGNVMIDASDNYNCMFTALNIAAGAIGLPGLIPQDVVDKFYRGRFEARPRPTQVLH
ncbi:hypothetical protein PPTG_19909 [Phytophthora nicotianae INRA-310]|uniref:Uncharacterized protein n=1 Tax=Phytophthora nicotianae (strain INRA-310) TaxID=761204 RepID=W2PAA0_PHYN3|nr:hypothetical protein PPTG_19909 [Phytophthora nicotianae INRA-310]ETM97962.1 hypothetical protein PPTG_19909 [Phytophthora nicotianae INRA-310]